VLELPRLRSTTATTGYLAVAAMVKNEGSYLAEWLAFYLVQGVEHVYLYDNDSSDDTAAVIEPFVRSGFVTVTAWPGEFDGSVLQLKAYHHALATYGHLYRWMAFIDIDEFLFPVTEATLPAALSRFEALPAVAVPWTMFGTSGHKTRPRSLVVEAYTMRGSDLSRPKSIVQPSEVRGLSNLHLFNYDEGRMVAYNERGELVGKRGPFYSDILRLNHYYTRSEEEFARKKSRAIENRLKHGDTRLDSHKAQMEAAPLRDLSIARFIPAMNEALRVTTRV
jgi:hypothetical protein